jgi:hypothetical protein
MLNKFVGGNRLRTKATNEKFAGETAISAFIKDCGRIFSIFADPSSVPPAARPAAGWANSTV